MEPGSVAHASVAKRLLSFVRDFLPAQNLQLLFPLASSLLLVAASRSWYVLQMPNAGMFGNQGVDPNAVQHFIRSYYPSVVAQEVAICLTQFAALAGFILCCLSIRNIVRKFALWVWIPAGVALVGFPAFLVTTAQKRNAALDALAVAIHVPVPTKHIWFPTLGQGFYMAIGGLVVLAVALALFRKGLVSLPLRFRDGRETKVEEHRLEKLEGRGIFVFVTGTVVWVSFVSWLALVPVLSGREIVWDSGGFPAFLWMPALLVAAGAAVLAFFLRRGWRPAGTHGVFPKQPFRNYLIALAIPLVCVLLPRFLLGVVFQPYLEPAQWPMLLIPRPLPAILIVYAIAFFEEFAIRGYLQSTLEKYLPLRRAIFVSGILWPLLLGFGMTHSLPHTVVDRFPGISLLAEWAMFLIYSVPLGWLYARTRSILAVTLMHGTIVAFHAGMGDDVHLNHPHFYWMELALWIFAGWLLFRKIPMIQANRPSVTDSSVPEPQN